MQFFSDSMCLWFALDIQIHMCNKLASRHVRVGLADPTDVPRCDICENAPGTEGIHIFFARLCILN